MEKVMEKLDRLDVFILQLLKKNKATSSKFGLTLKEINAISCEGGLEKSISVSNLRGRLKLLGACRFASAGLKAGNAKTYYVTQEGLDFLNV